MFDEMIGKNVCVRVKVAFYHSEADDFIKGILLEENDNFIKMETKVKEKKNIERSKITVINKQYIVYIYTVVEEL